MSTPYPPTYVYKNGFGRYYFRIAVPKEIRDIIGKYEIRRSLKTTTYSIAVKRARRMAVVAEVLFQQEHMKIKKYDANDPLNAFNTALIIKGSIRVTNGTLECGSIEMNPDKATQEKELLKALIKNLQDIDTTSSQQAKEIVVVDNAIRQEPQPSGMLLGELIEKYVRCQEDEGSWQEKTKQENQAIFSLLVRIFGDIPIQNITHDDTDGFRSTLLKLPPGINKAPQWRDLTIGQVLQLNPSAVLSKSSVNKYMRRVCAMFNWAEEREHVAKNCFRKKAIKEDKKPNQRRDMLSGADLQALFTPDQFHAEADKPFKYWLPLIALYTGARQNEIASMDGKDIRKIHGVWCFCFVTAKQKDHTERIVPVHIHLQQLGLIEYAAQQQSGKLFPEMESTRDGYGQAVSKWYGLYRRKCGLLETRNRDFHSYRHTVSTSLFRLDVKTELISEILGHVTVNSQNKSTTQEVYIKESEVQALAEAIGKLDYGNAVAQIKPYADVMPAWNHRKLH
jgi:integrase